jgi:hypothetical protein
VEDNFIILIFNLVKYPNGQFSSQHGLIFQNVKMKKIEDNYSRDLNSPFLFLEIEPIILV